MQYKTKYLKFSKQIISVFCIFALILSVSGCKYSKSNKNSIYIDENNWAYLEKDITDKKADLFFVCPTTYMGDEQHTNMPLDDSDERSKFVGATNMEKGIYDDECRIFAPFYRQAGLYVYTLNEKDREIYLENAYKDIKDSFRYYLENFNKGRPVILAGFSQGADMCLRLLKEEFKNKSTNRLLVACYAIGWDITEKDIDENKHLKVAQCENDTGVIISFNSEAPFVKKSFVVPEDRKTLAINPLNWKTDTSAADKSLNKGACFTDYSGKIIKEIPDLTGAYIDPQRGTLKVTDINSDEYPPVINIADNGVYHIYDYQFFYRNLKENVKIRTDAYLNKTN